MSAPVWEEVNSSDYDITERMSVIGGWIVRTRVTDTRQKIALVFIPDESHTWDIT